MKIRIIAKRKYPELKKLYDSFEVSSEAEICLAVGGDGTFIKAAKMHNGPVLPINGLDPMSVSYYSDLTIKDIDFIIESLKEKRYRVDSISKKLEVAYNGRKYYAVNEALLHNIKESLRFSIYQIVEGRRQRLYPYIMVGDGVIISNLVGSTAYNRAAGGPILLNKDDMSITFVNPDGPYRNSIVIDGHTKLEIEIMRYTGMLRYDGINIGAIKPGKKFTVSLSNKNINIIKFPKRYESFEHKLEKIVSSRLVKELR
ncbi:MAG: hypothetical protein QW549_00780 [Candidatus Micrarchaeaceae archaeon]